MFSLCSGYRRALSVNALCGVAREHTWNILGAPTRFRMSSDLSAEAKQVIEDLVAEGDDLVFAGDKVRGLRTALRGYATTDSVRNFGATIANLRALARLM